MADIAALDRPASHVFRNRPSPSAKARATPGCYMSDLGRYRSLVIVAHDGLYIHNEYDCDTAMFAINLAIAAIERGDYAQWHYHKLETGH